MFGVPVQDGCIEVGQQAVDFVSVIRERSKEKKKKGVVRGGAALLHCHHYFVSDTRLHYTLCVHCYATRAFFPFHRGLLCFVGLLLCIKLGKVCTTDSACAIIGSLCVELPTSGFRGETENDKCIVYSFQSVLCFALLPGVLQIVSWLRY